MKTPLRASSGRPRFTSLKTFLQGTVSTFQVVPSPNELGWRSLFGAWYFEDAIKLRPNLTLAGRPAPRIHHRLERGARDGPPITSPMRTAFW